MFPLPRTRRTRRLAAALVCTTAVVPALPAAAAQAAPASSVVAVQVGSRTACTGTLVAPRFVLTSARCTRSGGKQIATTRLRIVTPRSGTVAKDSFRVAAVTRAPKGAAASAPDVALIQLTSASRVTPSPVLSTTPKAGTRVRATGYATSSTARVVSARVVAPKGCRVTASSSRLCARLAAGAKPVARRCSDASGAALLVARSGRAPGLVGIGTRSARGCARRAQVTFTDVTTKAVPAFVATVAGPAAAPDAPATTPAGPTDPTAPATPPTSPTTPATPSTPAASALAPFVGTYAGTITENDLNRGYAGKVTISRTGEISQVVGTSAYGTAGCGGDLTYRGPLADGGVTLLETLTFGQADCVSGGVVTLALVAGRPAITYTWVNGPNDPRRADGVLQKVG